MGNELEKESTDLVTDSTKAHSVPHPSHSAVRKDDGEVTRSQHIHRIVDFDCPLIESQHDPNDLARELSRILKKRDISLTSAQRTLLKDYKTEKNMYYIFTEPTIPEEAKILAYSSLFNFLIFQGQLTKRVTIELNPKPSEQWDGETSEENGYAMITLWSQDHIRDLNVRLVRYLGITLQELTNAFLAIYGCVECRRNPKWQGEADHGEAWKDMMVAIQEAVEDHSFLDLDLKLGGLGAPAEGSRPGGILPSDALSR
ncbi:uncharacterized protein PAC_18604 [Phialocephala subalpina]|uniref:Uncharacterized protein n=1 Tax=Phialocephala subalpina TaxID=576137 RepID=A0A1L7XUL2_9HELO|nr:uncharacterized protein PAC_18604 [Phialocephala subalpina]